MGRLMKLIIAGSRNLHPTFEELQEYLYSISIEYRIDEIVSGHSGGVDLAGEAWSRKVLKKSATLFPYPSEHGKRGGPIRNRQMGEYADAALVLWDGKSRGAANMAQVMFQLGKPLWVFTL